MNEKERRADMVYYRTKSQANQNVLMEGLSGIIGSGIHLLVDLIVIPKYMGLWSETRHIYGRGNITIEAAITFLRPNFGFLIQDLFWDKLVGTVPIVGIPAQIAYSNALTWRLGAWFGLLSALGEEVNPNSLVLVRSTMQLTREIFPEIVPNMRNSYDVRRFFAVPSPDRKRFVSFLSAQDGLTSAQAQARTERALRTLAGDDRPTV